MSRKKQGTLEGMDDVNGKLIDTASVTVKVPKQIDGIEVRKMDNGMYRAMKDDYQADGESYEKAVKNLGKQLI